MLRAVEFRGGFRRWELSVGLLSTDHRRLLIRRFRMSSPFFGDNQAPSPNTLSQAAAHLPKLIMPFVALLLVTEALLALAVIFSRMSALQQFLCFLLMAAFPAVFVGAA